jgi:hypothetical protein
MELHSCIVALILSWNGVVSQRDGVGNSSAYSDSDQVHEEPEERFLFGDIERWIALGDQKLSEIESAESIEVICKSCRNDEAMVL